VGSSGSDIQGIRNADVVVVWWLSTVVGAGALVVVVVVEELSDGVATSGVGPLSCV